MATVIKKKSLRATKNRLEKLLQTQRSRAPKHNWSKFFGKVKFPTDAVTYQRSLRDE